MGTRVSPSARTSGGFRLYIDEDIERLELVKRMKPLDLTDQRVETLRGQLASAEAFVQSLADRSACRGAAHGTGPHRRPPP